MIELVLYGLLFSAVAIDASTVERREAPFNVATEAYRLVHQARWSILTTNLTDRHTVPTVLFTADIKGEIYFYMSDVDANNNNDIAIMFSNGREADCKNRGVDPWSPNCVRAMISGHLKKLEARTEEHTRASEALLSRYPGASGMGLRNFCLCKLNITDILVISGHLAPHRATPEDYYAAADPK